MKINHREREKETLAAALRKLCEEVPIGDYTIKWEATTEKGATYDAIVSFQKILHEYAVVINVNINL